MHIHIRDRVAITVNGEQQGPLMLLLTTHTHAQCFTNETCTKQQSQQQIIDNNRRSNSNKRKTKKKK